MTFVTTVVDRLVVAGLAAAVLLFTGLVVGLATGWAWLSGWDGRAVEALHDALASAPAVVQLFLVLDRVFDPWVWRALGAVVAIVLYRRGDRRAAAWMLSLVAVNLAVEVAVKAIVSRPRPRLTDPFAERVGSGFPSGHAFASLLIIGALLVLIQRDWSNRRRRTLAWVVGSALVLLVGLDRVAVGLHYPSDVVSGWLFAIVVLAGLGLAFGLTPGAIRRRADARGYNRRKLAIVLNPAKPEDPVGFRQQLERLARERGWPNLLWLETTVDDPGYAMTRKALAENADLVIAAGGDGTVRAVSSELAGTGVPLGVVPVGTGNLLARNLGIPLDTATAIRVALGGGERRIDVVRVSGDGLPTERFVVMAGLGLDAAVVGEAPANLKARLGWPAYLVSLARNLSFPAVRVDISVDGRRPVRHLARMVVVGNVGTLHAGLPLLPDAKPDDGRLDVVVVAPRRLTDWPSLAWRVIRRSQNRDDRLRHLQGTRVVVRALDPCPRQLDGDVVSEGRRLVCEVEPGVLVVRVPRT